MNCKLLNQLPAGRSKAINLWCQQGNVGGMLRNRVNRVNKLELSPLCLKNEVLASNIL